MFLRKTSRFKDGKVHDYWSVAENSRAGRRVVQRQLLYLGEKLSGQERTHVQDGIRVKYAADGTDPYAPSWPAASSEAPTASLSRTFI